MAAGRNLYLAFCCMAALKSSVRNLAGVTDSVDKRQVISRSLR